MNFLVIGIGSAGQRHLRVLHKFFGNQATKYVYRGNHKRGLISEDLKNEDLALDPIGHYNAVEIISMDALSEINWDLVVIATPPDSHYFYVEKIIKNSKKIIIEKPLTVDLSEALKVLSLAELNNIPVLVGYQMTFHPFMVFIKENLHLIGGITSCSTEFSEDLSCMNPFRSMHNHYLSKPSGGGAFLSLSHDLDFVLSIFDQTTSEDISFTKNTYSNVGLLVECNLDTTVNFGIDKIELASKFSLLPGIKCKTGKIQGLKACIEWDFLNCISEIKDANGKTIKSLSLVVDKDELFQRQIDKILSLKEFDHYCKSNLARAKFIVEANTKIQ